MNGNTAVTSPLDEDQELLETPRDTGHRDLTSMEHIAPDVKTLITHQQELVSQAGEPEPPVITLNDDPAAASDVLVSRNGTPLGVVSENGSSREEEESRTSLAPRTENCAQHPEEVLRMFCTNCDTILCIKCFFQGHRDHSVDDADETCVKLRHKLTELIHQMSHRLAERRQKTDADPGTSSNSTAALHQRLDTRLNELHQLIERDATQLRERLDVITQRKEHAVKAKNLSEMELNTELDSFIKSCERTVAGRAVDVLADFKQLETLSNQLEGRIAQLSATTEGPGAADDNYIELIEHNLITFLPLSRRNLVGNLVYSRQEFQELSTPLKPYDELANELKQEVDLRYELKKEMTLLGSQHASQTALLDQEWKDKLTRSANEFKKQLETSASRHEYEMEKLRKEHHINSSATQGHFDELQKAETKIAQLEASLAECRQKLSEVTVNYNTMCDKQRREERTEGQQRPPMMKITSTSNQTEHEDELDSLCELNKEVVTSPVVKGDATASKSPIRVFRRSSMDSSKDKNKPQTGTQASNETACKSDVDEKRKTSGSSSSVENEEGRNRSSVVFEHALSENKTNSGSETTRDDKQKSFVRRSRSTLSSQESAAALPVFTCNTSDIDAESIYHAYQNVLNDSSPVNWLILGYEDKKIVVVSTGTDYEAFKNSFTDDKCFYGYVRIIPDESSRRSKFILVTWIGAKVSSPIAAKMTLGKSTVTSVIKHMATELHATTTEHLDLQMMKDALMMI